LSDVFNREADYSESCFRELRCSVALFPIDRKEPATGGVVIGSQTTMTSLAITVVPEPSTCALAMIGLSAFAGTRRRKCLERSFLDSL
jgi:hypothetical protein